MHFSTARFVLLGLVCVDAIELAQEGVNVALQSHLRSSASWKQKETQTRQQVTNHDLFEVHAADHPDAGISLFRLPVDGPIVVSPVPRAKHTKPQRTKRTQATEHESHDAENLDTMVSHGAENLEGNLEDLIKPGPRVIGLQLCLTLIPPFLAICCLFSSKRRDQEEPFESFLEFILSKKPNAKFAADAQLAVRGMFFALLVAAPFFFPYTKRLVTSGFYSSSAVVMFIYTLYKSVGETMALYCQGIFGTSLAVFAGWLLRGLYPPMADGLPLTDDHMWAGVIFTGGFVLFMLVFNFDHNTRVFALSYHVYFSMCYFDPNAGHNFSQNFHINPTGNMVGALLQSGVGAGVAVLATLFPYPLFSLDKSQMTASKLCYTLSACWGECIDAYCVESRQPITEAKLRNRVGALKADVIELTGHIDNAWWECFDKGRPSVVRKTHDFLNGPLRELYNRLCFNIYSIGNESFSEEHTKMMTSLKPTLTALNQAAGHLLEMTADRSSDGHVCEAEEKEINESKECVQKAIKSLTDAFNKQYGQLNDGSLDENAFCTSVCAYGRLSVDIADKMVEQTKETRSLNPFSGFTWKVFSVAHLKDPLTRNIIVRNVVSIFLSFEVGYYGYGEMLPKYNSGIAGTAALLLSTGLGASPQKNFNRLVGVVLGTIIGQLGYAFFAWCNMYGFVMTFLSLAFWLTVCLFTYYNSTEFSGLACLLAAFGAQGLLQGCSMESYQPKGTYNSIISCTLGIIIVVLVDLVCSLRRPSEVAAEALMDAWDMYVDALKRAWDPNQKIVRFSYGTLMEAVASAEALNSSADTEPRIWRTAWRSGLYAQCVECLHRLREGLCNMEVSLAVNGNHGDPKVPFLCEIVDTKSARELKGKFEEYLDLIRTLLGIFLHEDPYPFVETIKVDQLPKAGKFSGKKSRREELADDITVMQREIATKLQSRKVKGEAASLERNVACNMSVFLETLRWQLLTLVSLQDQLYIAAV